MTGIHSPGCKFPNCSLTFESPSPESLFQRVGGAGIAVGDVP